MTWEAVTSIGGHMEKQKLKPSLYTYNSILLNAFSTFIWVCLIPYIWYMSTLVLGRNVSQPLLCLLYPASVDIFTLCNFRNLEYSVKR